MVSVDLSGPHPKSYAGNKYAVVVCAHLDEGRDLSFVRGVANKEAATQMHCVTFWFNLFL